MGNSLIEYKGSLLEVNSLENYLITAKEPRASTISLESDILTNNYGIRGFLLTDHQPEEGDFIL